MGRVIDIVVYQLRCQGCGFMTSSLDTDRTKAAMLDHLMRVHSGQHDAEEPEA